MANPQASSDDNVVVQTPAPDPAEPLVVDVGIFS